MALLVNATWTTQAFYIRESGSAIRFAVLHNLDDLPDPAELNNRINHLAPDEFLRNPSFKKNCDLICIHRLDVLAKFKDHEEEIFAIEEDPHFYKNMSSIIVLRKKVHSLILHMTNWYLLLLKKGIS